MDMQKFVKGAVRGDGCVHDVNEQTHTTNAPTYPQTYGVGVSMTWTSRHAQLIGPPTHPPTDPSPHTLTPLPTHLSLDSYLADRHD